MEEDQTLAEGKEVAVALPEPGLVSGDVGNGTRDTPSIVFCC